MANRKSDCTKSGPIPSSPELFIRVSASQRRRNLHELWTHRELLYFLAWRDVKIRYKQTVLGVAWAILQPLMNMLVFTIVFGRLAKLPSAGLPYPLFCFSALLPWTFFANGVTKSSNSLVGSENLIKKIYFPRLAIPLATIGSDFIDFGVSSVVLLLLMTFYSVSLGVQIILIPLVALQLIAVTVGLGCGLAALNVKYRDVKYVMPFMIQLLLFITPVAYGSDLIPPRWRLFYALNPLSGIVEEFRWVFLGLRPPLVVLALSLVSSLSIFALGLAYFERTQEEFADLI